MARQAIEYDGGNGDEVKQFVGHGIVAGQTVTLQTPAGEVVVTKGNWVVKGDGGLKVLAAKAFDIAKTPKPAKVVEAPEPVEEPPTVFPAEPAPKVKR